MLPVNHAVKPAALVVGRRNLQATSSRPHGRKLLTAVGAGLILGLVPPVAVVTSASAHRAQFVDGALSLATGVPVSLTASVDVAAMVPEAQSLSPTGAATGSSPAEESPRTSATSLGEPSGWTTPLALSTGLAAAAGLVAGVVIVLARRRRGRS